MIEILHDFIYQNIPKPYRNSGSIVYVRSCRIYIINSNSYRLLCALLWLTGPRSPGARHGDPSRGLGAQTHAAVQGPPAVDAYSHPGVDGILGCSGDLVSLLSNGACRAYYGLLWWLKGHTNWTY